MKKSLITMTACMLLFLSSGVLAAEKLIFAASEYPPRTIVKDGEITGSEVEIIQEVCKRLGITPEFRIVPWKRALKYMEEGEADAVFSVKQTEERSKFLYYSSEPIGIERAVILALKGSGMKVNSFDDLKGKAVGLVGGYAPGLDLAKYPDIKAVECYNEEQVGKMLAKGRFPLAVGFEINIKYFSKLAGIDVETVYVLEEGKSYIGFSKKAPNDKSLPEKFGKMLRTLKEEGVIQEIESKYF